MGGIVLYEEVDFSCAGGPRFEEQAREASHGSAETRQDDVIGVLYFYLLAG